MAEHWLRLQLFLTRISLSSHKNKLRNQIYKGGGRKVSLFCVFISYLNEWPKLIDIIYSISIGNFVVYISSKYIESKCNSDI